LGPAALDAILSRMPRQHDPKVLVGYDQSDDAGVYLLAPDLALVQTVDFFTPVVDDPYIFGQIAAANSLSDIYAMGGQPVTALTIVCFPDTLDLAILEGILKGGTSKMIEAGCAIIGGHSVRDAEIKIGYSVTGLVDSSRVFRNSGARCGDKLMLTKALGTGLISTAIKSGHAKPQWIAQAESLMTTLNAGAARIIKDPSFRVHAITDITGFGLLGHAREMAEGSATSFRIFANRVPLIEGALDCVYANCICRGLKSNREFIEPYVIYNDGISEEMRAVLYDPQTSGGLLVSVNHEDLAPLMARLREEGIAVAEIGEVTQRSEWTLEICCDSTT